MAQHVSEDVIKSSVLMETDKAQQHIHELESSIGGLTAKRKIHLKTMAEEERLGREGSDTWKTAQKEYARLGKQISENYKEIQKETSALNLNGMTMNQLKKHASSLRRELDNTSQALHPDRYAELSKRLSDVDMRMKELRGQAAHLKDSIMPNLKGINLGQLKTFIAGSGIFEIGKIIFENIAEWAGRAFDRVKELIAGSVQAAREAEGITHAFKKLNQPDILDNLRKSTRGTVSDLELMKSAVQANDFRLPLDQLGKYLEFAQLKAQQTGQDVDYLVNSIVTGLGRKSKPILDNLGISAAQLDEEMKKDGDMAKAVGRIIDQQMESAGEHFETAAEREQRATTEVTNAQLDLGNKMKETLGIGETSFAEMQAKAEAFVLKGLAKIIVYLQNLYDKFTIVRVAVEAVKVAFDGVFKVCDLGFRWLIDAVKFVGREIKALIGIIDGMFTWDWDKIEANWNAMFDGLYRGLKDIANDGKDVGKKWAENLVDSANNVLGKKKIQQPGVVEVTVVGQKRDREYWANQVEERKKAFEATKKGSKEAAAALKELKEAESKLGEYNTYSKKGSGGKSGKSEDKDNLALLKENRQKSLDQEKYFFDESVRIYKKQLSEKQISQQQFNSIQLSLAAASADNLVSKEKEYLERIKQMTFKDNKRKETAITEQQRNVEKAENDAYNARTAAYQNFQENMEHLRTSGMSEIEKQEYQQKLQMQVLEGYYQASLEYARKHGQDTNEIEEAYKKAQYNLEQDWTLKIEREKLSIRQKYGLALTQEQYKLELEQLEKDHTQKLLSEEEYLQAVVNLNKKYADTHFRARSSAGITTVQEEHEHTLSDIDSNTELSPEERDEARLNAEREYQERLLQIRQEYGLVKQQELYDQELEQLRLAKEQGYLTEEEYEKAKTQMKMDQYKEQFDYYKGLFSNAVNALQDAELANVEAKYDAEIDAAKKAGKDTSKLEEKAAEEKLKIQKKYADVQFAIRASEIIADTAQAIIATHKSLGGWTPWAIAAAALMGVTGAAQLAVAAAERNKVKSMTLKGSSGSSSTTGARIATGKEEGGFLDVEREQDGKRFHAKYDPNRRGYVDRPTVIVGEGPAGQSKEWIASNAAVENPTVRPILDILDRHQRAGSVRTLDLNKYLLQQRGYAQGGSIANTPLPSSAGTGISPELMERFVGVMERMERDGIPAILGLDEIDAKNKLRDKSRDIGSK